MSDGPYRTPGQTQLSVIEELARTTERARAAQKLDAKREAEVLLPKVVDLCRQAAASGKGRLFTSSIWELVHVRSGSFDYLCQVMAALQALMEAKGFKYEGSLASSYSWEESR